MWFAEDIRLKVVAQAVQGSPYIGGQVSRLEGLTETAICLNSSNRAIHARRSFPAVARAGSRRPEITSSPGSDELGTELLSSFLCEWFSVEL